MGRDGESTGRAPSRHRGDRPRSDGVLPFPPRPLQVPDVDRVLRDPPADGNRETAEIQASAAVLAGPAASSELTRASFSFMYKEKTSLFTVTSSRPPPDLWAQGAERRGLRGVPDAAMLDFSVKLLLDFQGILR